MNIVIRHSCKVLHSFFTSDFQKENFFKICAICVGLVLVFFYSEWRADLVQFPWPIQLHWESSSGWIWSDLSFTDPSCHVLVVIYVALSLTQSFKIFTSSQGKIVNRQFLTVASVITESLQDTVPSSTFFFQLQSINVCSLCRVPSRARERSLPSLSVHHGIVQFY